MHLHGNYPIMLVWLIVAIITVFALHLLAGLSFWAAVGFTTLGLLCILANGLLLTWEDEQPGGFNNPLPKQKQTIEHDEKSI